MNEHLRHLMTLGREHYNAGDYDRAEEFLVQVVEQFRGFADVFNMLGVIHHSQGRFAEAEEAFESALEINPKYTEAALNLSVTYNDRGKYKEAREIYQRVLVHAEAQDGGLDPFAKGKIANMHADLGAVYASAGLYEEATREYTTALKLCPTFIDLRTKIANVYRDMRRFDDAIREYEVVKTQRPDYAPARVALGVTFYSLGRQEDALAEWNDALDLDPGNRVASLYLRMVTSDKDSPRPGSALPDKAKQKKPKTD
jgi:tetratricopeptide (TPR) repeat protein